MGPYNPDLSDGKMVAEPAPQVPGHPLVPTGMERDPTNCSTRAASTYVRHPLKSGTVPHPDKSLDALGHTEIGPAGAPHLLDDYGLDYDWTLDPAADPDWADA